MLYAIIGLFVKILFYLFAVALAVFPFAIPIEIYGGANKGKYYVVVTTIMMILMFLFFLFTSTI